MKKVIVLATTITLAITFSFVVAALVFISIKKDDAGDNKNNGSISTYKECVDKGYPVETSFPSVCRAPDGKSFTNPAEESPSDENKAEAIRLAQEYRPKQVCTQVLVPAVHTKTGAKYTFPSGCLAPGWEPDVNAENG